MRKNADARRAGWMASQVGWKLVAVLLAGAFALGGARASPVEVEDPEDVLPPGVEVNEPEDDPVGPCSVVRKVGDRPAVDFDPLLGMVEVDPDHCVQRFVQRLIRG